MSCSPCERRVKPTIRKPMPQQKKREIVAQDAREGSPIAQAPSVHPDDPKAANALAPGLAARAEIVTKIAEPQGQPRKRTHDPGLLTNPQFTHEETDHKPQYQGKQFQKEPV